MWNKEVAQIWTNYTPPCRPSRQELDICTQLVQKLSKLRREPLKVLILGSTTEYRDWAYQERCQVKVLDNSQEYHLEISKELTHKNVYEEVEFSSWQDMNFTNEFDLVVGDLVIGNLNEQEVPGFLKKIYRSLKTGGYFLTKSFFYDTDRDIISPDVFFKDYEENHSYFDPFPFNAYNLTLYATDRETFTLKFSEMYDIIKLAYRDKIISQKTFFRYNEFGWENSLKGEFYVMPIKLWESHLEEYFSVVKRNTYYIWSPDFPYYQCQKTK